MDSEMIILSEVSQTDKEKYIAYIWNLKNDISELFYKREINSQIQEANL